MADNYWNEYWKGHRSRRRFMSGTAALGTGAAALALVGCGGDDDGGGNTSIATPTPGADATPTPNDPFANAKKGGTYRISWTGDPPTIDPYGNLAAGTKTFAGYVYSRLFKMNAGPGVSQADLKPVGDLAETVEASPDGLVWNVKLRDGIKFHNTAPVSGRALTTDDIRYSWGRATAESNTNRTQVSFIDKLEYPDERTLRFTLKAPNAAFVEVLADANLIWIMPKEADGGFNPGQSAIGTGPWSMDQYQPSVGFIFKKNPTWHVPGFPLMDSIDVRIIPEYATSLAQFRAGNLDAAGITSDDIVDVKTSMKTINLDGVVPANTSQVFFDSDPNSPWAKDPRVKQAMSMAIDREGLMNLGYNVKSLKAEGLAVSDRWNNLLPVGLERFWLDPRSAAQGDSKKFFEYNVAEAKKLLEAAGFGSGLEGTFIYTANRYGASFNQMAEAHIAMFEAIGVKVTADVQDYSSKYITQTAVGNFKGFAFGPMTPYPEVGGYPLQLFTDNPRNRSKIADPVLNDLALKQQQELDPEKRKELIFEIQRKNAEKMHYIPDNFGAGTTWTGIHGRVKNFEISTIPGTYGGATEEYPYLWLDA